MDRQQSVTRRPVHLRVWVSGLHLNRNRQSCWRYHEHAPLPELPTLQTVTTDQIYSAAKNSIYSVTTGSAVWTGQSSSSGVGAVAGSYVLYVSGTQVVAEGH